MQVVFRSKIEWIKFVRDYFFLSNLFLYFFLSMLPISVYIGFIPVLGILLHIITSYKNAKYPLSSYHKWFIIVLIFFSLSVLWSIRGRLVIWVLLQQLKCFIVGIGVIYYCNSISKFIKVNKVFLVSGIFLLGFVFLYFDLSMVGSSRLNDLETGFNANGIANVFVLSMFSLITISFFSHYGIYAKIFGVILGILFLLYILFTGSRGAILMLVLPIIIYLFLKSKYKLTALFIILGLCLLSYFLIMSIPSFYNVVGVRFVEMFQILEGDYDPAKVDASRLKLFELGWTWFKEKPFFGYGINNYRELSNMVPGYIGKRFYAHSNIIELLVDVGIIGFSIYYSFVLLLIKRVRTAVEGNFYAKKMIIAFLVAFVVRDIVSVSYYDWDMQYYIALMFSFVYLMQFKSFDKLKYEVC